MGLIKKLNIFKQEASDSDEKILARLRNNPNIEDLQRLKISPNRDIRTTVANHYMSTPTILHSLAKDPHYEVRFHVAMNENTHSKTLHMMAKDPTDYETHAIIAGNKNTHPETLHMLSSNPWFGISGKIASHPNSSFKTLYAIAKSKDPRVHHNLLEREDLHPKIIHRLAAVMKHHKGYFPTSIAYHPNISSKTLHLLSTTENYGIFKHIIDHPKTTLDTLRNIAIKSPTHRKYILKKLLHPNRNNLHGED